MSRRTVAGGIASRHGSSSGSGRRLSATPMRMLQPIVGRFVSLHRTRRTLATAVAATVLIVAGGSIAAAVGLSSGSAPAPVTASGSSSGVAAHWTAPMNEKDTPDVETPGGATLGDGGFNAISCPTLKTCVAVGGDDTLLGVVATSSNDGSIWVSSSLESGVPEMNAVDCSSANDCVAVGQGATLATTTGGNGWTSGTIPTANTTLLGVSCASSSTCVSVGVTPGNAGPYGGQVLVSSDGGATWRTPTLPVNVGALGSVACPSTMFCVAVGAQILVSTDGGQSWTPQFVDGGTGVLRSVSCASATVCVAIGSNPSGLTDRNAGAFEVVTSDGGATWTSVAMPAKSSTLNAISCSNGSDCVVGGVSLTGAAAPSWTSSDGGETWMSTSFPTGVSAVGAMDCTSVTWCVFVGQQGSKPASGTLQSVSSVSTVVATQTAGS